MLLERHFSEHATTGRGLRLVAGLGADFSIDSLGADGKVVWFTIDGTASTHADGVSPEWDLEGPDLLDEEVDTVVVRPPRP